MTRQAEAAAEHGEFGDALFLLVVVGLDLLLLLENGLLRRRARCGEPRRRVFVLVNQSLLDLRHLVQSIALFAWREGIRAVQAFCR